MKLFKVSTLLALCAACLLAGSVVTDAKKFTPTSFVARKNLSDATQSVETLTQSKVSGRGVQSKGAMKTRGGDLITAASTRLSYYAELVWTVGIAIFMVVWLRSKSQYDASPSTYVDEFPNFNEMVLKEGFW